MLWVARLILGWRRRHSEKERAAPSSVPAKTRKVEVVNAIAGAEVRGNEYEIAVPRVK